MLGMCREGYTDIMQMQPIFVGTDADPVQIDQSCFEQTELKQGKYYEYLLCKANKKVHKNKKIGREEQDEDVAYCLDGKNWV